jgi:hypothetical protein
MNAAERYMNLWTGAQNGKLTMDGFVPPNNENKWINNQSSRNPPAPQKTKTLCRVTTSNSLFKPTFFLSCFKGEKTGVWEHHTVSLCPPFHLWTRWPIFTKFGRVIISLETTSNSYFIAQRYWVFGLCPSSGFFLNKWKTQRFGNWSVSNISVCYTSSSEPYSIYSYFIINNIIRKLELPRW